MQKESESMQKSGESIEKSRESIEKNRNRLRIDREITESIRKFGELIGKNPDAANVMCVHRGFLYFSPENGRRRLHFLCDVEPLVAAQGAYAVQKTLELVKYHDSHIEGEFLNVKDYELPFCDGRGSWAYQGDTRRVIQKMKVADYDIIGTPIFQGSFTGALKNLFDLAPVRTRRHKVLGWTAKIS
ncbi:NAD(P)H-dependent oxidoreductase [Salibacterium lacus]|uniref:NAD(P)H-dependent oxidoreductase n=1 Tax=Salibacterium lacus TaxID=1898109 RepID=A0ABW5T5Y3_9BACI